MVVMHYYKRNLGDYAKKAGRLSMLQHGAYTLLLDSCYDREEFPTKEQAIDWTWASTTEEIEAVEFVLRRFFVLEGEIYIQPRVKEELDAYQEKASKNKRIAQERETKRKEKQTKRARGVNESPPNQEPRTKNQEPEKNISDYVACPSAENPAEDASQGSAPEALELQPPGRPKTNGVPYQKIIDLYHEHLPDLCQVRALTPARKSAMKARWNNEIKSLESFAKFFRIVAQSDFLTGRLPPTQGRDSPWQADFDWLMKQGNVIKIVEGKYRD